MRVQWAGKVYTSQLRKLYRKRLTSHIFQIQITQFAKCELCLTQIVNNTSKVRSILLIWNVPNHTLVAKHRYYIEPKFGSYTCKKTHIINVKLSVRLYHQVLIGSEGTSPTYHVVFRFNKPFHFSLNSKFHYTDNSSLYKIIDYLYSTDIIYAIDKVH